MRQYQQVLQIVLVLLQRRLKIGFSLLFLGLMTASCSKHQEVSIDKNNAQFISQESNKLFFRNMRQPYYDKEEMKEAKMEVFRIGERDTTNSRPILHVKIVQHLLTDKAFAMIEPNAYFQDLDRLEITWQDSSQQQGRYIFQLPARQEAHFQFATELYTSIQKNHQLQLVQTDSAALPVFEKPADREAFRKTMVDFYRLVGLL